MDVAVAADVAVDVGVAVGCAVGVVIKVDVGDGTAVVSSFPPPQAINIGTTRTKARASPMNLYHKLLFEHMINYLLILNRKTIRGQGNSVPPVCPSN